MLLTESFQSCVMKDGTYEVRSNRRLQRRVGQACQRRRLGRRRVRGHEICGNLTSHRCSGHFGKERQCREGRSNCPSSARSLNTSLSRILSRSSYRADSDRAADLRADLGERVKNAPVKGRKTR